MPLIPVVSAPVSSSAPPAIPPPPSGPPDEASTEHSAESTAPSSPPAQGSSQQATLGDSWGAETTIRKLRESSGRSYKTPVTAILVVLGLVAGGFTYVSWVRPRMLNAKPTAFVMGWVKGGRARYHVVMALSGRFAQDGRRLTIDERLAMDMAWQVVSIDRGGVARLRVRVSNGVDVTNGTRVPQEPQTFFLRVARDGRVLAGADLGTTTGQSLDPGIPGMDQITPILPNGKVRPGEEWTKTFRQAFPFSSTPLRFSTRSTLLRYESFHGARNAVIDGTITVPVRARFDLKAMAEAIGKRSQIPKNSNPWISINGNVNVHQVAWFDVMRKEVTRTTSAGRFAMALRTGGLAAAWPKPIRFSGTITLELTRL